MAATLRITGLTSADRDRWTALWSEYLSFYETTLPDAQFEFTWERLMGGTALHGLAARMGDTIVGITHFLFHESAWTMTPACYLQDLFVDGASRRSGAGQALVEAVASAARAQGSTRMYWLTQDHNATARRLYDRIAKHSGFIRYEYPL